MDKEQQTITRVFSRNAAAYDQHAAVQMEVGQRLLQRLDGINFDPRRILDLGCGTGAQSLALHERFRDASIVAMDLVMPMLRQADKRRGWWKKRFDSIVGNAMQLPLATSTFDLVHTNLMLQSCEDIESVLANLRRVLKPSGLLLVSTLGPDTLNELRRAGDRIIPGPDIAYPTDVQRLGSALSRAGFSEPVLDTDWLTVTYTSPQLLLTELECIGAIAPAPGHRPGSHEYASQTEWMAAGEKTRDEDGRYPVTWEAVYASAWSPDEGQPIRTESGEEASFSVNSLKVRRR
jgi:malonyl-CoA O-methyltransferase